jgi:hypothetical protein
MERELLLNCEFTPFTVKCPGAEERTSAIHMRRISSSKLQLGMRDKTLIKGHQLGLPPFFVFVKSFSACHYFFDTSACEFSSKKFKALLVMIYVNKSQFSS